MASERIPFRNQQESGSESLAGASPIAMNVVIDSKGAVRRRPGITTTTKATSEVIDAAGIAGLYVTEAGAIFATSTPDPTASVYKVGPSGALLLGAPFYGSNRPTFAETEMLLTIAAGAGIRKIVLSTLTSGALGGDPPRASHVIANASRLLANDTLVDRTKVRYSSTAIGTTDYSGLETWDPAVGNTAGFFTAEARPDAVVALAENTNEVFVWGSDTLQVYDPDPTLVYAPAATREVGCSAPYSIIKRDQEFYWLDNYRRFVHSDGRTFEVLSDAIKSDLDGMASVIDAFGYRVLTGAVDALVWTFPTDGRTYAYQVGSGWGQWSGFDAVRNNWAPFVVTAHHLINGDNANLVGTSTGQVGLLSATATSDFSTPINAYVITGFQDHATDARKQCVSVRLALRRGQTTTGEPRALLSWRDSLGPWEAPIPISLGVSGDTDIVVELRSLGIYRRRQWRFSFDGTAELVLVAATEEFDVLSN